jgi:hypothetical protein
MKALALSELLQPIKEIGKMRIDCQFVNASIFSCPQMDKPDILLQLYNLTVFWIVEACIDINKMS